MESEQKQNEMLEREQENLLGFLEWLESEYDIWFLTPLGHTRESLALEFAIELYREGSI